MPSILTIGEALVEIMRPSRDLPLHRPAPFMGPYPSGAPAIYACAAARLIPSGSPLSVGFVGSVGRDAFGHCVRERLQADGVDCRAVRAVDERLTGIAFVSYASDGGRQFLFHLADSAAACVDRSQIPDGYLDDVRHLHVMGSALTFSTGMREACYAAAEEVHARGGTVSLDPNLRPELMPVERIRAVCAPVLRVADWVLPSGSEATTLTGAPTPEAAAEALLEGRATLVALKRGAEGSTLYTAGATLTVAAYPVVEVDPTGAGDCYDAALTVALLEGRSLSDAGALASAAGALAVTQLGPLEGAPSRKDLERLLAGRR